MRERNITAVAVECLSKGLAAAGQAQKVASRVPASRPPRFVRVSAQPGRETSITQYAALVTVQVYDTDADRAWETATTCVDLLKSAVGQRLDGWVPVQWAKRNSGPYEYPDPNNNESYRFQAVIDWGIRLA